MSELLIACENLGWSGVSRPFFRPISSSRLCREIVHQKQANLENVLHGFVCLRNESGVGHGIPGDNYSDKMLDAVGLFIERLSHVLPELSESGDDLHFRTLNGSIYKLKLLKAYSKNLVCYREIKKVHAHKCKVIAQVQTSLLKRLHEKVVYEVEDVLDIQPNIHPSFDFFDKTKDESWCPLVLVPNQLTENFTGRSKELEKLQEWANDSESRACIIYGDGGIGKTTLTVEFLNRFLEGNIDVYWQPKLITFYTAKQTRWGLAGLEKIRATDVGIADVATFIVRAFEGYNLDKKWFIRDANELIQKLSSYLRNSWGIDRDSHLLVLDNTETMAESSEDVSALGAQIRELSKRVGRVIVTSRRREVLEAAPIGITAFGHDESVEFLRSRAEALNRKPILQAGNSTLRKYANGLDNKPIMLEVFVQALNKPEIGLQNAFDRVRRMLSQDLGEFLYTDAWHRLSQTTKHLLILMTRIADTHDEMLLKLCCIEANVTVMLAMESFEESRGIATTTTVNNQTQITFSRSFVDYCQERTVTINGEMLPSQRSIEKVKRRYQEILRSLSTKIRDRVDKAYRHAFARAARLAFQEGRIEDCELYYEEAIVEDGDNGWLFDRYAYFLFSRGAQYYEQALQHATKATDLARNDPETWFTRGMIEGRMGKVTDSSHSLNRAKGNGKLAHLCLLQRAYAHLNDTPPDHAKAIQCLDEAESLIPFDDDYYYQNIGEIRRVRGRIDLAIR